MDETKIMTAPEDLENLLQQATQHEQLELKLLHNAVVNNAKKYQENPSAVILRDWNAAKAALDETKKQLHEKYSEAKPLEQSSFSELVDVLLWLQENGWKIAKRTIFKHQKEGKITRDRDLRRFVLEDVERYARKYLRRLETGRNPLDEMSKLQDRKLRGEVRRLEAMAEKAEIELHVTRGIYINREDMERELVGRALVIDSSLRHMIKTGAAEWVDLVGGRQEAMPELINVMLASLDTVMNTFAGLHDFVIEIGECDGN